MFDQLISELVLSILIVILFICIYISHKVRRIHVKLYEFEDKSRTQLVDLHHQLEALHTLSCELEFQRGLPPTRGWSASPDFLLLIARHVLEERPETILECGSGTSTVVIARALQLAGAGHLYSLEHDSAFAEISRENLSRYDLTEWATVIDAPLRLWAPAVENIQWYEVEQIPDQIFDLLVIDGPPMPLGPLSRYPAGPVLFPVLKAEGHAFVDDAKSEQGKRIIQRWKNEFPNLEVKRHDCEKGCVEFRAPELRG